MAFDGPTVAAMPRNSMKASAQLDPGSFRDPAGRILHADGRVFRTVAPENWKTFEALQTSGLLDQLVASGMLWPATRPAANAIPDEVTDFVAGSDYRVMEHPVLPFVSYPYEWPFALTQRAALLHLDLQLELLEHGYTLVDGTAYNVQFSDNRPVFIDTLSIVPYKDGDPWLGYQQFCTQFLNPLLLMATRGIGFHAWFRGALEGIGVQDTAKLLPWRSRLSFGVMTHVLLHAKLLSGINHTSRPDANKKDLRGPSRIGLIGMLRGLRRLIAGLKPKGLDGTRWNDYADNTSYDSDETEAKKRFIADFTERTRPGMLWDFGCNTGAFSEVALGSGASRAIGFDFDLGALESAVARADAHSLPLLPLFLDATNPSPRQGWRQMERAGLSERSNADALLALAFLHHLVIGKNIPIGEAVKWLVDFAPAGVVEFVPKSDPMVRGMLAQRADIFPDYNIETFRHVLSGHARIVKETPLSQDGRTLFVYER